MKIEYIPITMINENLSESPYFPMPEGFRGVTYCGKNDDISWAKIESSVNEFKNIDKALEHFHREFGSYEEELKDRCFFIENDDLFLSLNRYCNKNIEGSKIGTATAWYNNSFLGESYGRLHWIAICPKYQGRKLGKPLVSLAVERLKKLHDKAYLTSQTTSYKAINMYLDFGFRPFLTGDGNCMRAWRLLASHLKHPALAEFLK